MASDDLGTIVVVSPMVGEDHLNAIRTAASDREVIAIRDRDEWQERRDELAPTGRHEIARRNAPGLQRTQRVSALKWRHEGPEFRKVYLALSGLGIFFWRIIPG